VQAIADLRMGDRLARMTDELCARVADILGSAGRTGVAANNLPCPAPSHGQCLSAQVLSLDLLTLPRP
jgi:hypothetical protein